MQRLTDGKQVVNTLKDNTTKNPEQQESSDNEEEPPSAGQEPKTPLMREPSTPAL